ncbi:MAG: hypothetical protein RL501_1208 [Bacteroidota bacterium]|jgi:uncharacterized cupredoxin-like copper-binding protein
MMHMKTITSVLVIALALTSCKDKAVESIETTTETSVATEAQTPSTQLPVMTFEKTTHDFGTIKEGEAQQTVFTFTNTGSAPLIITNATSSCGCTVPDYPKNTPIAPGDSGQLTVNFNGTGMNKVTKTIRVEANTASGFENIKIEAFIEAKN